MSTYTVAPGGIIRGTARVPGDKSISHRSIMLGALAEGVTTIDGFLEGEDALATLHAFRDMGVNIEGPDHGRVVIHGVGLHGLKVPAIPLDLGNAGTAMRLMAGLMVAQPFASTLVGDASLMKRPMARIITPLQQMGANIVGDEQNRPPLHITPVPQLNSIHYDAPVASAQVQSSILLAGLYAAGETSVTVPDVVRDHTARMLKGFGASVRVRGEHGETVLVQGGQPLTATAVDIPADISSAAFFMVAALIAKDSELSLTHVGINPTRAGVLDILKMMGGDITLSNQREVGGEPVADITVRSSHLKGIEIPQALVSLAIDEFPIIAVAAACASGTTIVSGAAELRVKESDRIAAMVSGLQTLGITAHGTDDGMVIAGQGEQAEVFSGGRIQSQMDHRIAMSFAVAALRASAPIMIDGCEHVATSFPSFVELANALGLRVTVED